MDGKCRKSQPQHLNDLRPSLPFTFSEFQAQVPLLLSKETKMCIKVQRTEEEKTEKYVPRDRDPPFK